MITGYDVIDEVLRGLSDPENLERQALLRLESLAKDLSRRDADLRVVLGDPAAEILALRSMVEADLVVLGAGHIRGLRRFVLGSVADRLLRNPGPPLLLVRRPPAGGTFRRVLVGAEYTHRVGPPVALAVRLAEELAAEIDILHVFPPPGYLSDEDRVVLDPKAEGRRLTEAVEPLQVRVPSRVALERGDPADVIPEMADRVGADLVVVGAQRHPDGWPGRITDRVARADLAALLVVWPPESPASTSPSP
jgi:nucleotide-binding universal stress UspA family protein